MFRCVLVLLRGMMTFIVLQSVSRSLCMYDISDLWGSPTYPPHPLMGVHLDGTELSRLLITRPHQALLQMTIAE